MYAIENELGRFVADTEKDAKKQLRAAQRKHKIEQAKLQAIRETARTVAYKHGYTIYSRFLSGQSCPLAWLLYRGQDSYGFKVFRMYPHETEGYTVDFDTPDGRAKINYWRAPKLSAVIIDGGGYAKAIEADFGDGPKLFVVGYSQGVAVLEPLEGIPADWFRVGKL